MFWVLTGNSGLRNLYGFGQVMNYFVKFYDVAFVYGLVVEVGVEEDIFFADGKNLFHVGLHVVQIVPYFDMSLGECYQ